MDTLRGLDGGILENEVAGPGQGLGFGMGQALAHAVVEEAVEAPVAGAPEKERAVAFIDLREGRGGVVDLAVGGVSGMTRNGAYEGVDGTAV